MTEEEIFDRMDDYLMGRLLPEAAKAFEADLARHPEWQEEFDMRRIEHEGMELLVEDKLRADMRKWDKEPILPNNSRGRWYMLGVALLLGVVALVFFMKNPTASPVDTPAIEGLKDSVQPIDNQTIPAKKEEPPVAKQDEISQPPSHRSSPTAIAENSVGDLDLSLGTRGDEDEKTFAFADSLDAAIAAKDYRRLLRLTEQPTGAHSATLRYMRGWAFFKLRNFAEAEKIFEQLVSENNARLNVKSQRMLMYSLLAQFPKQEKALGKLLDEITGATNHPLKKEADGVKKAID